MAQSTMGRRLTSDYRKFSIKHVDNIVKKGQTLETFDSLPFYDGGIYYLIPNFLVSLSH